MGQAWSRQKKAQQVPVTVRAEPEPSTPPVDQSKTSSKESSKTVSSGPSAKEGTTDEGSTTSPPRPLSRYQFSAKKISTAVIAPEKKGVKASRERQTYVKDGVKIVKQFENGRLVSHTIDGVPQKLPNSKEKLGGLKKIGSKNQRSDDVSSLSSLSSSSSSSPPLKRTIGSRSKRSLSRRAATARCKSMEGPKAGAATSPHHPPFFSTRCLPRHPATPSETWGTAAARREFLKPGPRGSGKVAKWAGSPRYRTDV